MKIFLESERHKRVMPFVDTMTMSDTQFEMAKKEGKIPTFMGRNRLENAATKWRSLLSKIVLLC